ncbi:MAG: ATP-binding protein [Pseudomonadota bacterium]
MTGSDTQAKSNADLLADTFDRLTDGIAIYDADEKLVLCNREFRHQLQPISDLLAPGAPWRAILRACVDNDLAVGLTGADTDLNATCDALRGANERRTSLRELNGRFFDLSYNPIGNGGFFITRADVTERVEAETRLKEREALLSTVFETNPTPVVMARLDDSRVVYLSPAARELFGDAERSEMYYASTEDRARYVADLREHGKVRDRRFTARAADGSMLSVSVTGRITDFDSEACVVSSVTDVTQQLAQDELIRLVVEACPAPILMNNADTGEILFRSPQASELYGDLANARDFYVSVEDREKFLGEVRRHREVHEYRLRLKDAKGVPFWSAVSARLIQWGGEDVIVSHSRDLTGQLAIEEQLARQREQVFQTEKMSALGSLLAGVAHELNNPLSVVVGHAMMLADEAKEPDMLRQINKIGDAAERCSKIVRTFLTMARQDPVRMAATDIADVMKTAVNAARYGNSDRTVDIALDLEEGLPQICADRDQITQVIVNLIINAEQAIEDSGIGGLIRVSARSDPKHNKIQLEVADDGPGIPPNVRARIFEPFFTTKGVGRGTGMGLSVCHRAIAAHDGKIEINDAAGSGTRFTISLPVGNLGHSAEPTESTMAAKPKSIRVLVIDDEADVADLNAEVLQRGGYDADAVYNPETVLEVLRTRSYDVVLSDLNMPGLDGRGVFETISQHFPELISRTGFITGDTMGHASQTFLKESRRPYIEKPVSPKELREFVAQLSLEGTSK